MRNTNKYMMCYLADAMGVKYKALAELEVYSEKFSKLGQLLDEYFQAVNAECERDDECINVRVKEKIVDLSELDTVEGRIDKFIDCMEVLLQPIRQEKERHRCIKEDSETWTIVDI